MRRTILIAFLIIPLFLVGQNQQKEIIVQNKDWKKVINTLFKKADSLFNDTKYDLALSDLLKIDSISKANDFKNDVLVSSILMRSEISKLTFTKESTIIAVQLAKRALKVAEEINDLESIHNCYKVLADLSQLVGNLEETKMYIDKALPYYLSQTDKNPDREASISRLYLLESVYYNGLKDVENADKSRYRAVEYLKDKNNDPAMAKATYFYGHYLRFYRDDCLKAITYLEKSKELCIKIKNDETDFYHRCLRDLAICYDEFGDIEKSKKYYKEAYLLSIQLTKKANRNTSRRLETKYQTEKKEQEIQLLTSQKQLAEQQKKSQRNILIAGVGITGIAGLFLFVLFRNRQKTTDKLKELDVAKSKFFANISHEFRTPLTLINNPIETALSDPSLSDKKREQFKIAKRNSDRLLALVNQLLDLSKIDAGYLKLHIQKGQVTQIIAGLADSFSYSAEQKHINYSVTVNHANSETYFDKDAIEKIGSNLLSNAVKYTPEQGHVSCNASVKNSTLILEIKNSGKGLTTEEANNIFQRFYQTSEDNIGSGIGLALVKELVELHKGTIVVDSQPNLSTIFTVRLPVDKNSFKNEAFIETQEPNVFIKPNIEGVISQDEDEFKTNNQPILLIVEDNSDVRTLLKQTFEEQYNILTAKNGQIGIELALEHIPDIIISDIMMPVKDGIALTNELKNDERTSHIPIILLTAKAGEDNEIKGIQTGADDYITKPFSTKILTTKVSKLIEIRKKLQDHYSQELVLIPKNIAVNTIDERFLEKVQTVLDEKLIESNFSIEDFSKAVGMSRMQLHRKLKALTGLSASDFIRSQRLKLAAALLKKTDSNMSQVGYTVGFNDHSYFTKRFKEAYGCTPSDYAKRFN